jgi:citrate lyase subunit beta/citryl-CoA lyase
VLVETPLAVINAYPMARASERVIALLFGAEDLLLEMQARHDVDQLVLHAHRSHIVLAARAAGVEPLDTPYLQVRNLQGLRAHANRGRDLGMSGMLVLSPRQIPVVHEVYSPSEPEIQEAREISRLAEEARQAGRSYAVEGSRLVSPSSEKRAAQVLARAEAIGALEKPYTSRPSAEPNAAVSSGEAK